MNLALQMQFNSAMIESAQTPILPFNTALQTSFIPIVE